MSEAITEGDKLRDKIFDYFKQHPLKHAGDGLMCATDSMNIINQIRGAGLITVATIEFIAGPVVVGGIIMRHHFVVKIHKPAGAQIDPLDVLEA